MIVVDTSVWIEYLKAKPAVYSHMNDLLKQRKLIAASPVFGELLQGVKNKREQQLLLQYWSALPKYNETDIWLKAGILSAQCKFFAKGVGLIDSFLITLARQNSAYLWTFDKKLIHQLKKNEQYLGSVDI